MGRSVAIFDMDGTLADSMYFWKRAPAWVLYGMGHLLTSADEIAFQSVGFEGIPAYLVETYHLPCTPAEFRSRIDSLMLERYRTDVLPWPDVPEYQRALSRRGIRSVILTASAPPFIQTLLERFSLAPYFEAAFSAQTLGLPKSDPAIYNLLFRQLNCRAEDCILFEDSPYAVRAAAQAGIPSVGILDPSQGHSHAQLNALCIRTVSHYSELLEADIFAAPEYRNTKGAE